MTTLGSDDLVDGLRRRCSLLPAVREGLTHDAPTPYVGRRSFAKFVDPAARPRLDQDHVGLWAAAPAGARKELVSADPQRFFVPRFGGRDWIGMRLDDDGAGLDWAEVDELLRDAYRQVAPQHLVRRLDRANAPREQ